MKKRLKWEEGYIKAYTDYYYNGEYISQGEYVKPLYDDGNNKICVERENGKRLWINLEGNRESLNPHFFFLAG